MEYRKQLKDEHWHFCRDCTHWPSTDYFFSSTLPQQQSLCRECQLKTQAARNYKVRPVVAREQR